MELLKRFQRIIAGMELSNRIIIGVSGGADSLALLHLFVQSREAVASDDAHHIQPYVVHVHHGIRGDEADQDAAFVADIAEQLSVSCRIEYADVPELARQHKLTVEEAARKARYTLLAQAAQDIGARMIAIAHNADDQAETVLMHLLRGSGLAGLRGMLPITTLSESHLLPDSSLKRDISLIRPLLDVPRSEIDDYCAAHGLQPRIDHTNADTRYFRNRIRHELLPVLKQIAPSVVEMIGRTAKIAAADYDLIQREAEDALPYVVRKSTRRYAAFGLNDWNGLPVSLQREIIRQMVEQVNGTTENLTLEQIDRALELAQNHQTGARAELAGGIVAHITQDSLYLTDTLDLASVLPVPDMPLLKHDSLTLPAMGEYPLPDSTWRVELSEYRGERTGRQWKRLLKQTWSAVFAADALNFPLTLRTRQPSLKFYPQGAGGSQSLKEFMNKAKIPTAIRDQLPILTHGDDVIWVCGYRVDERFIVLPETKTVWLSELQKIKEG